MNQILLVLGSMMLLLLLSLVVNNAIISKAEEEYQSESVISATTMAHALLQEISLKAFDEATVDTGVASVNKLTTPAMLGRESGDVYPHFDDIDDYNGFSRTDTVSTGFYHSSVTVDYVSAATPEVTMPGRTYFKRISVSVRNPETMSFPVTLTSIISY